MSATASLLFLLLQLHSPFLLVISSPFVFFFFFCDKTGLLSDRKEGERMGHREGLEAGAWVYFNYLVMKKTRMTRLYLLLTVLNSLTILLYRHIMNMFFLFVCFLLL